MSARHGEAYSCETQLVSLVHAIADSIDRRKQLDLVILDFGKVLDLAPHQRLLVKINYYWEIVHAETIEGFKTLLNHRD